MLRVWIEKPGPVRGENHRQKRIFRRRIGFLRIPDFTGSSKKGKILIIKKKLKKYFLSAGLFIYSFFALYIWEKIVATAPIVAVITPIIAAITPGFSRGAWDFVGSAVTGT
jgi:hypothetical protein